MTRLVRDDTGIPISAPFLGNTVASRFGATATTASDSVSGNFVRIVADAAVHINASGIVASRADPLIPANSPELFAMPPGVTINMIGAATATGVLGTIFITNA